MEDLDLTSHPSISGKIKTLIAQGNDAKLYGLVTPKSSWYWDVNHPWEYLWANNSLIKRTIGSLIFKFKDTRSDKIFPTLQCHPYFEDENWILITPKWRDDPTIQDFILDGKSRLKMVEPDYYLGDLPQELKEKLKDGGIKPNWENIIHRFSRAF